MTPEQFALTFTIHLHYVSILDSIAKCLKNAEQKFRMSRRTTKAYCRMVRRTTQTDEIYVSITGYFAIEPSIYEEEIHMQRVYA